MTTSGTSAWPLTARDMVTAALQDNAIIPLGDVPSAEEMAACIRRFNSLLKSWNAGLHREETATITVAGNPSLLDPSVGEVIGLRSVAPGFERPLQEWTRADYYSMPNRTQTGIPRVYYASRQLEATELYLWPVPDAASDFELDYIRVIETITDASQTVDIPERYQEALIANLAVRCAGMFGTQAPPELIARAQRLEREMMDAERPRSYHLGADCAGY